MSKTVGAVLTTRVVAGFIEDHKLRGELREFPENIDDTNGLIEVPAESLCDMICDAIAGLVPKGTTLDAAGVALARIRAPGSDAGRAESAAAEGRAGLQLDRGGTEEARDRCEDGRVQRCGRGGGRDRSHARANGSPGARVDHRQRHRLRALSVDRRPVGGWPHGGDARPEGNLLRLRRARASGRRSWGTAPCGCASSIWSRTRFSPRRRRATNAVRSLWSCWHRALAAATASHDSPGGRGALLLHGPRHPAAGVAAAEAAICAR